MENIKTHFAYIDANGKTLIQSACNGLIEQLTEQIKLDIKRATWMEHIENDLLEDMRL